jgi:mono/diheme cytochrome c family protein
MDLRAAGREVRVRGLGARRSALGRRGSALGARRWALGVIILAGLGACRSRSSSDTQKPASRATSSASPTARKNTAPKEVYLDRINPGGLPVPAEGLSTNGYATDSNAIGEGARLFVAMNCDGCHGGGAVGWVGPSLSDGRWRYGGSDAEVFRSIYYGQRFGMPAYGGVLQPQVIWKLVAYLKSLPPPKDVPTEAW